jgi:hypothetical protein
VKVVLKEFSSVVYLAEVLEITVAASKVEKLVDLMVELWVTYLVEKLVAQKV